MSLNAATIRLLVEKGLSALDIADIAEAMEPQRSSAAVRQANYRARNKAKKEAPQHNERDVTRDVTPPPIESNHTPHSPSLANANDAPRLEDRFVSAWNDTAKRCGFAVTRKLNTDRVAKLKRRVKEHGEETVFEGIERLSTSKFHCGENDRNWRASAGWYLRSTENIDKAMEFDLPAKPGAGGVDVIEATEKRIALYRKMGRDEEADEAERALDRMRGPPVAAH